MLTTLFCALFCLPAFAGPVTLRTDTAVSVERGGVTIGRASGAGILSLGEFPPGETRLRLHRHDRDPLDVQLVIPTTGSVTLELSGDDLLTNLQSAAAPTAVNTTAPPSPVVIFRPLEGQRFTILLAQGVRVHVDGDTILDQWTAGEHAIEVRSEDHLTVWARGTLRLEPGDHVVVSLETGRAPEVRGPEGAWRAVGGRQ